MKQVIKEFIMMVFGSALLVTGIAYGVNHMRTQLNHQMLEVKHAEEMKPQADRVYKYSDCFRRRNPEGGYDVFCRIPELSDTYAHKHNGTY